MGEPRLCVLCGKRPVDPRWRPFCGERCRNEDLARWVEGRYSVPAGQTREAEDDHGDDEVSLES